jgi:branched-chain amino acid transport system permease protein
MALAQIIRRLDLERNERAVTNAHLRLPASWPVVFLLLAFCVFLGIGSLRSSQFAQQTVSGLATGSTFGLLALALVLIYRATEVVNLAQGQMAMFSAYIAWQLIHWGLPWWPAAILTLLISFVGGVGIERLIIRPVEGHSLVTVVIVTIGLFLVLDGAATWIWSGIVRYVPSGFSTRPVRFGGVAFSIQDLCTLGVSIGVVLVLWLFFQFTKVGLAMRAAALRPASARLVGVRVGWMLALGWGLAAVLGAIAGLMIVPVIGLQPSTFQPLLLYAFAAAVLGGLESPAGAVVGGLALGAMLNLIGTYWSFVGSILRLPVALAVLLAVLLIRPAGLFGRGTVRKV